MSVTALVNGATPFGGADLSRSGPKRIARKGGGAHWIPVCLTPVNLIARRSAWGQLETFAGGACHVRSWV